MHKHGGDIYTHPGVIDFSANINYRGMPKTVSQAAGDALSRCAEYPDPSCLALRAAIGEREGIPPEWIICGNGAADLIFALVLAVRPQNALITSPAFFEYEQALSSVGCMPEKYHLLEDYGFELREDFLERITPQTDLVFLCNPNNPTGVLTEPKLLKKVLEKCENCQALLVLDECFNDFLEKPEYYTQKGRLHTSGHLFLLKAFTKMYAMAGLRLGYGMCSDTALLEKINMVTQPWNVSTPAQAAGIAACCETDFAMESAALIQKEKEKLKQGLISCGYSVLGSAANYIFFKGPEKLFEECLNAGILIRDCGNYEGLKGGWYRIAVKSPNDNQKLLNALKGR